MGWSQQEELLCVQEDGMVLIYDMFGNYQHTFSMGNVMLFQILYHLSRDGLYWKSSWMPIPDDAHTTRIHIQLLKFYRKLKIPNP